MKYKLIFRKPFAGKDFDDFELKALDNYAEFGPIKVPADAEEEDALEGVASVFLEQHPEYNSWDIQFVPLD